MKTLIRTMREFIHSAQQERLWEVSGFKNKSCVKVSGVDRVSGSKVRVFHELSLPLAPVSPW